MKYFKTPWIARVLFPNLLWKVATNSKTIYLTFDDGPKTGITDWVLDVLSDFNAKASFFLVGDNVKQNPQIVERMVAEKHAVGNHTMNHLNLRKTTLAKYQENIQLCQDILKEYSDTNLFRPPYGQISFTMASKLKDSFRIVMWDVLSYDFDSSLDPDYKLMKCRKHSGLGSVIVFHDSVKSENHLRLMLPAYLKAMSSQGYLFKSLENGA